MRSALYSIAHQISRTKQTRNIRCGSVFYSYRNHHYFQLFVGAALFMKLRALIPYGTLFLWRREILPRRDVVNYQLPPPPPPPPPPELPPPEKPEEEEDLGGVEAIPATVPKLLLIELANKDGLKDFDCEAYHSGSCV